VCVCMCVFWCVCMCAKREGSATEIVSFFRLWKHVSFAEICGTVGLFCGDIWRCRGLCKESHGDVGLVYGDIWGCMALLLRYMYM